MKKLKYYLIALVAVAITLSGCESYLHVEEDATAISEEEIFGSYNAFQGFVDQLYEGILDVNKAGICVSANLAGENMGSKGWNSAYHGSHGDYWALMYTNGRSIFTGYGNNQTEIPVQEGVYEWGWRNIRVANYALEKLEGDMLTDATDEEKQLLAGQAHFFRAYLHWELVRSFGSIPYVDKVLNESNYQLPRYWEYEKDGKTYKNSHAVLQRCAEDLQLAADALPWHWADDANVWETQNSNTLGRITKGAAYGLMAKVLLYAGSPLFNEDATGSATYNADFCSRAADAAWKVINSGVYELVEMQPGVDLDPYRSTFATTENVEVYTKETIFIRVNNKESGWGESQFTVGIGRLYSCGQLGSNAVVENPSQQYVDKWEMADGSVYKSAYDTDFDQAFNNRDPRFRKTFWVHNDMLGTVKLDLSDGGKTYDSNMQSPYFIHKFWVEGVDKKNQQWAKFHYGTPVLRLADMYLIYAEALYAATGNATSTAQGASLTALDAVNEVRARALMPAATADAPAYITARPGHGEEGIDPFMRLVRNERAVELSYEGNYWFDVRRWKIGTQLDKVLWRLDFDANYSVVNRVAAQNFVFENRHWWVPFLNQTTQYYEGWPQNPGW